MKTKTLRTNQSGSIMLEVVAVLALMGVMGAMLFRQIYQRNQELHNIQMASEIRTVKEAFSAYIQANRAAVNGICESCSGCAADLSDGKIVSCGQTSSQIASKICEYLPDGWFGEDLNACSDSTSGLPNSYKFQTFAYKDANDRTTVYGIVAPTENTLPTTGWNFKRAARVALLVGADGGAYSNQITRDYVNGSLGSWELPVSDITIVKISGCAVSDCPTYVANTGIDIFAPEYEAPEGKVSIPEPWSLKLNDLHAYSYFSVGNSGTGDCYTTIGHDKYSGTPESLGSDVITKSLSDDCKPLFWVGLDNGGNPTSGNVYVQNDLNVGADMTGNGDHALTLTKEGIIKQKEGLIIDKYGRIFSRDLVYADIGDLKQGEHFVLDLARTSTMKDIRLASRGGARLSEILPNYILKEVYDVHCKIETNSADGSLKEGNSTLEGIDPVNGNRTSAVSWCDAQKLIKKTDGSLGYNTDPDLKFPDCPTGYKKAIVVIPSFFGNAYTKKGHTHTTNSVDGASSHSHTVYGATYGDAKKSEDTGAAAGDKFVTDICQSIALVNVGANQHALGLAPWAIDEPVNDTFRITLGYRYNTPGKGSKTDNNQTLSYVCKDATTFYGQILHATVQTYCVWEPALLTTKSECQAAGYKWDSTATPKCTGKPYAEYNMADQSDALEIKKELCECLGFEWGGDSNPRCIYKFIQPSSVKSLKGKKCSFEEWDPTTGRTIGDSEVITICKMLGYNWDGTDCECPGDQTWNDNYGCQNPDPT